VNFEFVGHIAGFFTTVAFIPQVLRVFRTRSSGDLSWAWLLVFVTGLGLWLTYGLILRNWPIILSNLVTLSLCFLLIAMKLRYKNLPEN
jgi:MtN3 and saliva related transmembrane protein